MAAVTFASGSSSRAYERPSAHCAPSCGSTRAAHQIVHGRAPLVDVLVYAQGSVNHVCFTLRRLNRAIFATGTRHLHGKNSARISIDGEVRILEDGQAVVDRIEPRDFTLERRSARGRAKTMAANVDLLVTVTALSNPPPRLVTLDQLLAFAEIESIKAAVILTKPDLSDAAATAALLGVYRALGYPTIVVNPKIGENLEALRESIAGHHAMLAGNSGVGKSTIFRALGGESSIGDVSRHGLGRQTTTAGRLYRLGSGFLIDSPGINEFGLGSIDAKALTGAFREMREPALNCRFADCTHVQEPECAVRQAVDARTIPESRYASYRKMLLEPS